MSAKPEAPILTLSSALSAYLKSYSKSDPVTPVQYCQAYSWAPSEGGLSATSQWRDAALTVKRGKGYFEVLVQAESGGFGIYKGKEMQEKVVIRIPMEDEKR